VQLGAMPISTPSLPAMSSISLLDQLWSSVFLSAIPTAITFIGALLPSFSNLHYDESSNRGPGSDHTHKQPGVFAGEARHHSRPFLSR
jgi:hypothetical protein